jgi:hypothetical protein
MKTYYAVDQILQCCRNLKGQMFWQHVAHGALEMLNVEARLTPEQYKEIKELISNGDLIRRNK